jgi:hypothetical protein
MPVLASFIWSTFSWMFYNLPWLIVALMAALVWSRQRKSYPLMLEVVGAVCMFVLSIVSPLILWVVEKTAPAEIKGPAAGIMGFLQVVALLIFVAGFTWEKWLQRRQTPAAAVAVPVAETP